MFSRIFQFVRISKILLLSVLLFAVLGLGLVNVRNANQAIAATINTQGAIAYDINKDIDQQRKQATEKRYGEDVGKVVVDDALKNNKEESSSKYRIKADDSLPQRASKVTQQVKDRGLVDEKTQS